MALLMGAATAVLALPGLARAENRHGPKVDDLVAAVVDNPSTSPTASIPVIVFGRNLDAVVPGKVQALPSVGGVAARIARADVDKLAADPNVAFIAADRPVDPTGSHGAVSPAALASLYPFVDGATAAWARGFTGAGVAIAVVDSGVQKDHNLKSRLRVTTGVDKGNDWFGHGTFVADVAAGRGEDGRFVGVAPGADVVSVELPPAPYTSDVVAALAWVSANQARYNIRVLNLSLSENAASSYLASALDAVVEQLWKQGVVVVVAAGNRGPGNANYAPGNDPMAISVGATDTAGTASVADDSVTTWSSSGDNGNGFAKPELVAPGRLVPGFLPSGLFLRSIAPAANVVDSEYLTMSGTSFAAPQVAGAAAVLLEEHPGWSPNQVKWVLTHTSRALAAGGASALDLDAATAFAGAPGSANQGVAQSTFGNLDLSAFAAANKLNQSSWSQSSWSQSSWSQSSWSQSSWSQSSWSQSSWSGFFGP